MMNTEPQALLIQSGSRARLGARFVAAALTFALVSAALVLSSCAPAERSGTPLGDTPVTVITSAAPNPISTSATTGPQAAGRPGYRLVFDDEFSDPNLNTARWITSLPWGHTNHTEQQYYEASALSQSDGVLTITASKRASHGKPYTSGAISSKDFRFAYGYAEIRAQVPAGDGLWSAFWLLARSRTGNEEADIMELLGSDPSKGYAVLHYGTMTNKGKWLGTYRQSDFSNGFHTFALDWQPGSMTWYVDGVKRYEVTRDVPSNAMVIIANLTVGGPDSWSGAPDRYTPFPSQYKIDYIRVYQLR